MISDLYTPFYHNSTASEDDLGNLEHCFQMLFMVTEIIIQLGRQVLKQWE